jgi:thioredoxin reductase (NADPH)
MTSSNEPVVDTERILPQEVQADLKALFAAVPHKIPVYLFSRKEESQAGIQTAVRLMRAFQEVTDKIEFKEYDLSHRQAKKWNVSRSPTLVFDPARYKIHYLGVPLGEEGRTLVETMILIGLRASQVNEESRKVLKKLDGPRQVRVFVTPTCPYCPQQAVNAVKAAIERPDLVSVEIVDTSFNPDLTEKYSAFSVPQTYANEVFIAKGAQPMELFAASLERMEEQTYFIPESEAKQVQTDVVVIGGGPAGLTAGIYAARSGLKTVIIERDTLGGQVATTPVVENYPGLARIGGKTLVDIMVAHALEYVQVFPREAVLDITLGDPIQIRSTLRSFTARAVLFATGASNRKLGVPGEDRLAGRGVSYCSTCDGPLFKGRKVAIVGGGDSAVTEALHLRHIGADVTLIHRRDSLRAQEYLVKNVQENGIPVLYNTEVREIKGQEKVQQVVVYNNRTKKTDTLPLEGVFVSVGYTPEVELARKIGVDLTPDGYIKNDGQHRTNLPGIYSAGDVEGGYKQIVTAAGAGAGAAITLFEDLSHPYWKDPDRGR